MTGTIKFLGSMLDGRALLTMMVCLSPAAQNGCVCVCVFVCMPARVLLLLCPRARRRVA